MTFIEYPDVERLGSDEVDGILVGTCYIFPKIDGTNSSVWWDDGLQAGSRKRHLTLESDNGGFYHYILNSSITEKLTKYFGFYPYARLYGEFLIPHSLKTYRDEAWRKFYVFDVSADYDEDDAHHYFLHYDQYVSELEKYGLDYIPVMEIVSNPTEEHLRKRLFANTFLIEDGKGVGEGIVIKRYDFLNKWGRVNWAKLVRNEFKEQNLKAMGPPEVAMYPLEAKIVDMFVTQGRVDKIKAKIRTENDGNLSSRMIPELLGRVWNDLVTEEIWNILKKFKQPTIDFRKLHKFCVPKVKELTPELFGGG